MIRSIHEMATLNFDSIKENKRGKIKKVWNAGFQGQICALKSLCYWISIQIRALIYIKSQYFKLYK